MSKIVLPQICLLCFVCISHIAIADDFEKSDKLRTLFTTPLERNQLDDLRNSGEFDNVKQENAVAIRLQPLKVEVKGVVYREKGNPVVFVNEGNTLKSNKIDDDIRVRSKYVKRKNNKVPLKVNEKSLKMKPGQTWIETEDKVKDNYQTKRPKVETKEAAPSQDPVDNKELIKK